MKKRSMAFIFYTFLIRQVFATFYDLIFRAFKKTTFPLLCLQEEEGGKS